MEIGKMVLSFILGGLLSNFLYIGALDYEARKKKAEEEAKRIEQEYKQQQISLEEAKKKLEGIQLSTGSKYTKIPTIAIAEKVAGTPELAEEITQKAIAEDRPQHYGSTAKQVQYYYDPKTKTKTYRADSAPPPKGAIPITIQQYETSKPLRVTEREQKEFLVRERKPSGELGLPRARKSLPPETRVQLAKAVVAQETGREVFTSLMSRIERKRAEQPFVPLAGVKKDEKYLKTEGLRVGEKDEKALLGDSDLHSIDNSFSRYGGKYRFLRGDYRVSNIFSNIRDRDSMVGKVDMGKIEKTQEPKWYDFPSRVKQKGQTLEFKFKFRSKGVIKKTLLGASVLGTRIVYSVSEPFFHPKKYIKGTYQSGKGLLITPRETVSGIVQEARVEPIGFIGDIVGQAVFLKGATKGIKKVSPKISYQKLKVPTTTGEKILYRGITIEKGTRGKPLIGVAEGKINIGTPKIPLKKSYLKSGLIVETPAQTAIIRKSIPAKFPKSEVAKFEKGLAITRSTELTPSRFVQRRFIQETKTLTPSGVKEVLKFSKKQKAQVYGSYAARQQMPPKLARKPADIDVQLPSGISEAQATSLTKSLVSKLRRKGRKVRIGEQSPTLIEAKVGKEWHHAVDIHTAEQAIKDISSPAVGGERVYGLRLGQKPIKIEGVQTMRLSEQGVRKFGSIATIREKGFAPAAHRLKDIPDWFATQETLIRSKLFGKTRLLRELEKTKALYPEQLFKAEAPSKVQVYAPKQKVAPSGIPSITGYFALSVPKTPSPKILPSIGKPVSLSQILPSPSVSVSISKMPKYPSVSISKSVSKSLSLSISKSIGKSISPSVSPKVSIAKYPSLTSISPPSYPPSSPPSYPPSSPPSYPPSSPPSYPPSSPPSYPPYLPPSYPPLVPPKLTDIELKLKKPRKRKPSKLEPTYKPSLVGLERFKVFGVTIPVEPRAVSLGVRPLTKQMAREAKRAEKSILGGMFR
jgi:hypothetical protein